MHFLGIRGRVDGGNEKKRVDVERVWWRPGSGRGGSATGVLCVVSLTTETEARR